MVRSIAQSWSIFVSCSKTCEMERVGLFPLHHKISYACFVWVFGLGLFLFLMVHGLLANHYYYYNSFEDNNLDYAKTGNTSNYHYASDLFLLFNYNFNFQKNSDGNSSSTLNNIDKHKKNPYLKNILKKKYERGHE